MHGVTMKFIDCLVMTWNAFWDCERSNNYSLFIWLIRGFFFLPPWLSFLSTSVHHLAQLLKTNRLTCDGNPFLAKINLLIVAQKALQLASWPITFI